MAPDYQGFRPERYESDLAAIVREVAALDSADPKALDRVLRRHPKDGAGLFSKSEILLGFRHLDRQPTRDWNLDEAAFVEKIRMKPVRTASGVAPVTVLTRPFPCPGRCIFCPSDVRMPKSYIASEPGARRAAQHRFDPYAQTLARLTALDNIGHRVDKAEVIVLGGTWSSYPESYQVWFVKRCFDALNAFRPGGRPGGARPLAIAPEPPPPAETVDGLTLEASYNRLVQRLGETGEADTPVAEAEAATWSELAAAQRDNESAVSRCVGLVVETRPDHISPIEVERIRRLGATKVQIGIQSLSDRVLALNNRGHDVAATRRAFSLLRGAGFKIHAHWMPNLYGSSPEADVADFERLFADPGFRPDELKIYPCSLVETAELMAYHADGRWRPYQREELLEVLAECLRRTPEWCRVTRVIRDIPGTEIVDGNRETNLREAAERRLADRGVAGRDIRAREVRTRAVDADGLALEEIDYATSIGREVFLQYVTPARRLAGFLRLALPSMGAPLAPIPEIAESAIIREVHVYGRMVGLGERRRGRAQHAGLGSALTARAAEIAAAAGYADLAVISAVGTRDYYRRLGFTDGPLYQHLALPSRRRNGRTSKRTP